MYLTGTLISGAASGGTALQVACRNNTTNYFP
jgi:hypothetical protein